MGNRINPSKIAELDSAEFETLSDVVSVLYGGASETSIDPVIRRNALWLMRRAGTNPRSFADMKVFAAQFYHNREFIKLQRQ